MEAGEGQDDQPRALPARGPLSSPPTASWAVQEMINHWRQPGCVCCMTWVGAGSVGTSRLPEPPPSQPGGNTKPPGARSHRSCSCPPGCPDPALAPMPNLFQGGWTPMASLHWEEYQPVNKDSSRHIGLPTASRTGLLTLAQQKQQRSSSSPGQ